MGFETVAGSIMLIEPHVFEYICKNPTYGSSGSCRTEPAEGRWFRVKMRGGLLACTDELRLYILLENPDSPRVRRND
ncbi:MAG: hypothetical protein KAW88_04785 [Candidatus Cloacimonetes bacterium]|nr:hypothetical protein [Candidatus Cloacimonadota bacterium]